MSVTDNKMWRTVYAQADVEAPRHAECRARVGEFRISARINNQLAEARFKARYSSGSKRRYPDGLENALEIWLQRWGYGGLDLQSYLDKMFDNKGAV